MRRLLCGMGGVFLLSLSSAQAQIDQPMVFRDLRGTIGPYPVGMMLIVRDDGRAASASYFYEKNLIDIPLTVKQSGTQVMLCEPGGGRFDLGPEKGEKPAGLPGRVTDLVGIWQDANRSLPVRLHVTSGGLIVSPQSRYRDVTDAAFDSFESMVRRFRAHVLKGEHKQAVQDISYPLRLNLSVRGAGMSSVIIPDRKALLARWSTVFTSCLRSQLARGMPHNMFVHNGMAMMLDGQFWFDAKGLAVVNPTACKEPG